MATTKINLIALLALLVAPSLVFAEEATPTPGRGNSVAVTGSAGNDPTRNVLDLVEAAIRRQDDLRASFERLSQTRFEQAKELSAAQDRRIDELSKVRAEFAERLANAEAKRIDAIRSVDVNQAAVATQRTTEQATALQIQTTASAEVLRAQVARSAEDLRALVATTAATALQTQQQQFAALSTRITTLEQAGSESRGSARFQDPATAALVAEVRKLSESRAAIAGADAGQGQVIALIVGGLMLFFALIGAVGTVIVVTRRKPENNGRR